MINNQFTNFETLNKIQMSVINKVKDISNKLLYHWVPDSDPPAGFHSRFVNVGGGQNVVNRIL